MGKFGWHSGAVQAQNLQSGSVDVSVDASGDGTASVTFSNAMKEAPKVTFGIAEADTTGTMSHNAKTNLGFIAQVDGSSVTGSTLTVDWIAFNDRLN